MYRNQGIFDYLFGGGKGWPEAMKCIFRRLGLALEARREAFFEVPLAELMSSMVFCLSVYDHRTVRLKTKNSVASAKDG